MPNGRIQPEFTTRLKEMGEWLGKNGASIYATRGGPVPPREWGVTTWKGDQVFVHVFEWPDKVLSLPKLPRAVKGASFLRDGSKVLFKEQGDALLLTLGDAPRDPYDTVVVLSLASR
jgi:alpha-L-fucosidase